VESPRWDGATDDPAPNILIVDDSATMRTMIKRVLSVSGSPVGEMFEAANGQEALAILAERDVQLLFTDINMPIMTGVELLREMQQHDEWRDIVRIIISTDGSEPRRQEAQNLDVRTYIEKPFRPEVMRDVLSGLGAAQPAADDVATLGRAVVQVAENSLFAYAEPCDLDRLAALLAARDRLEPWLSASIAFTGPLTGMVWLSLPEPLAEELYRAFSGVGDTEVSGAQVFDFAGELANMACGLWLTNSHRSARFELSAPSVTATTREAVVAAPTDGQAVAGLLLNDVPLQVAVEEQDAGKRS
jgi:two-component system chemotaxis response regulator CheY